MSKHTEVPEFTPMDAFENAIRRVGVVAACEWFGYAADSEFTRESALHLQERERASVALGHLPAPPAAP